MLKAKTTLAALLIAGTATMAVAYAQNPDVQKRQEAMGMIGSSMKKLGQMMKGEMDFDVAAAQAAVDRIAAKAADVPALFETPADDPESDALEDIWANYADFTAKAEALNTAASGITISSMDDLGAAMGQLNGTCKACHSAYKM